jgi:hypothetical protein
LTAAPPAFEVRSLGGDLLVGPIVELSADRVTLQTPEGRVSLGTDEVVGMSPADAPPQPASPAAAWVELVDGSRPAVAGYSTSGDRARLILTTGDVVEIPTRDVAAVQLRLPTDAAAEEWSQLVDSETTSDLLVIGKGDAVNYHRGVLRDVADDVVRFELEGDVLPVKRVNVLGLVYYRPAGRALPEVVCRITETDGSQWAAASIGLDGEGLRWRTPLAQEAVRPASAVARVDFSQGKIVYLSDLEPESIVWKPYFGSAADLPAVSRFFAPRMDRGLEPGPLELDGKPYHKGLALHSRTSVVYRLPGRFRRFRAVAGIDDRVRPRGSVQLVIRGDDRVLFESAVAGTDPPRVIDVDCTGVRRLAVFVDYGPDLDVADHLDLCEARVVK